jgi:hypothetical protein
MYQYGACRLFDTLGGAAGGIGIMRLNESA